MSRYKIANVNNWCSAWLKDENATMGLRICMLKKGHHGKHYEKERDLSRKSRAWTDEEAIIEAL